MLKDCYAFKQIDDDVCVCFALEYAQCRNGKCNFYKTKDQYLKDLYACRSYNDQHGVAYSKDMYDDFTNI